MADQFMLAIHNFKEGRTTMQFFPSVEAAKEHQLRIHQTFDNVDTYVAAIINRQYGSRT
jgi:hypothetical protein